MNDDRWTLTSPDLSSRGVRLRPARERAPSGIIRDAATGTVYLLGEQLGRGGMGVVYRAFRDRDHHEVALKLPADPEDGVAREFLRREARILARLSHEGLPVLVACGDTSEGEPYLATELEEGHTLDRELTELGRLSSRSAVHLCRRVAVTLHHVHLAGVIHRDLKPANILVRRSADLLIPTIIDFGISSAAGQRHARRSPGSIVYMPPEQMSREPLSERSDIYQLGLVFFLCLTGRLPFEEDVEAIVRYRLSGNALPEWFSPDGLCGSVAGGEELVRVLAAALERDPRRRLSSMWAFDESLACLSAYFD